MKLLCILSRDFAETLYIVGGSGIRGVGAGDRSQNQFLYAFAHLYIAVWHANPNEINALSGSFSSIYLAISQPWPGRANQFCQSTLFLYRETHSAVREG